MWKKITKSHGGLQTDMMSPAPCDPVPFATSFQIYPQTGVAPLGGTTVLSQHVTFGFGTALLTADRCHSFPRDFPREQDGFPLSQPKRPGRPEAHPLYIFFLSTDRTRPP